MALILDGKQTSQEIKQELKKEVKKLKRKKIEPALAVVLIGNNPASEIYVKSKKRACEEVGIKSISYFFKKTVSEKEILKLIEKLNNDKKVHGILIQLPLPPQIREDKIIKAINPKKDVDGFHVNNLGKVVIGKYSFIPCTPAGIIELLDRYKINIEGKNCVVVGKSNIVGKPVSILLMNREGTVITCHSLTKNLKKMTLLADILIVAAGKAKLISADMVKKGVVIIDVGINRDENNKICGDVVFKTCSKKASAISPVPGGVGPMTIAMLMKNCVRAAKKQKLQN